MSTRKVTPFLFPRDSGHIPATFGNSLVHDTLEILSWVFLLAAGLLGLWRLQWMPVAHDVVSARRILSDDLSTLRKSKAEGRETVIFGDTGKTATIDEQIDDRSDSLADLRNKLSDLELRLEARYSAARICFIVGVSGLVFARAYMPTVNLFLEACRLMGLCN